MYFLSFQEIKYGNSCLDNPLFCAINRNNYLNNINMVSAYILTIKSTNEKHYFTTLVPLFNKFDYETLRIKRISLHKHSFKKEPYENKHIIIEKVWIWNNKDVIKEKEQNEEE